MVVSNENLAERLWSIKESYFVFNDWEFLSSLFMIIICPVTWNLVARWEFHTKIFSKLAGDNRLAADVFAHILIEMGILRNYLFSRVIRHQNHFELDGSLSTVLTVISVLIVVFGFALNFMAYYRLGIHGIYYADYFDILFPEMVTAFPYNVLDNPLYVGSFMLFFGNALFFRCPAGILLSGVAWIMYKFASILENPMTALIYSPENIKKVRKMSKERDRRESQELKKLMG
jgi:phosphatidylethanolamine N-methyltransferase